MCMTHAQNKGIALQLTAYSSTHADVFSIKSNASAGTAMNKSSVGVYSDRPFLMKAFSSFNLCVVLPTAAGPFGLIIEQNGSKAFHQTALGIGYARKLANSIDLGLQFQYGMEKAGYYGHGASVKAAVGARFHITDHFCLGIQVQQPKNLSSPAKEKKPAGFSLGGGWEPSQKVFIAGELFKEEDQPLHFRTGLTYYPDKCFVFRAGYASGNGLNWSAGTWIRSMRLEVTGSYHTQLGFTPGLALVYQKRNTE